MTYAPGIHVTGCISSTNKVFLLLNQAPEEFPASAGKKNVSFFSCFSPLPFTRVMTEYTESSMPKP
jgi:hypothetical protein